MNETDKPACTCQARIKDAIKTTPSAGHDYVDEVLGLLRVAQGQRDSAERLLTSAGVGKPNAPETGGTKAVISSNVLGEPHLTLMIEEIRDLAQFCGMVVKEPTAQEKEDERETEITIAKWHQKGVWDEEQKCQVPPHKHIAYFDEYPEEGVLPLGSPNL